MAKPTKRRLSGDGSGRYTPKAGTAARSAPASGDFARSRPAANSRYTPPTPEKLKLGTSPRLVPISMGVLLGLGVVIILVNYLSVLLPGAPSNWYLIGGLGFILAGILVATQWR